MPSQCLLGVLANFDSKVRIVQSVNEVVACHCFASSVLELGKSKSGVPSDVRMEARGAVACNC